MTTTKSPAKGGKKPKAPAKKTAPSKKPSASGKPSLSQQKRLKALRGSVGAPPARLPRTEAPESFRELRDKHERALKKRIPYPEPLGAIVEFKPYPFDPRLTDPVEFYPQAKIGSPPLPAAQKRDKKLLYAALGIGAFVLAVLVYIGGGF